MRGNIHIPTVHKKPINTRKKNTIRFIVDNLMRDHDEDTNTTLTIYVVVVNSKRSCKLGNIKNLSMVHVLQEYLFNISSLLKTQAL